MSFLEKYRVPLAVTGILLASLAAGRLGYTGAQREMRGELMHDVINCAAAFDPEELRQLTGTPADVATPAYESVKRRLMRFRQADTMVRFIYIFRHLPESDKVIFLADSEVAGSPEISLPGDEYTMAYSSPGLQASVRSGLPAMEGPLEDEFGVWVTGYAPIVTGNGRREIVGIDIAANDWMRRLWLAGLQRALYIWLLLGLPLAGWLVARRQQAQREVIRNLFEAMEQSPSAVMIADLEGRIEYANAGFCRQLGHARRDLIARPWRDFKSPGMTEEQIGDLCGTVRSGHTWCGEWSNRRRDGSFYPVRGSVTPVRRRQGEVACFVAVFEDMTEVKRGEAVLREALERAEAGDKAKSQFLATMSHEVRTPLNGIVGFTNLLLETPLSDEQREYMQTIQLSAEAMIQLTSDMLDFARIESGKFKLDIQPCDPRECLEDALDLLAARALEKKIELLHWVEPGVPALVQADAGRLRQVLINLIGNAVKFTDAGEVGVTLSARALDEDRWELHFSVRDTGPGITEAQQLLLFKPFSQVEGASTRRHGGTGLGLAISRNLVHLMGGQIAVESRAGAGAVFSFSIVAPQVDAGVVPVAPGLAGLRLAVVAAPGSLREELVRLARSWEAGVVESAPETLPDGEWEVMLLDMDQSSAARLAALPAERPGWPRAKIIGLVPLVLSSELRGALRTHCRLLVNKPVHHQTLRAMLTAPAAARPVALPSAGGTGFDLRVLLVEDNPVNQRLMQRVLTKLDCQWTLADNGHAALGELSRRDYDLVLMDLHMPVMDGPEAIAQIRRGAAGENARAVWIVALTADARENQRERVLAAGANDYLTKPLKATELDGAFQRFREARDSGRPAGG